jgi:hypothetical protein
MDRLPTKNDPVNLHLTDANQRRLDRLAERETIIRFDDADPVAHVYTCHAKIASALQRRGTKPIRVDYRGRKAPASWTFTIPRTWFKVPGPPRKVSEAQREARVKAGKRLSLARGQRQGTTPAKASASVEG